MPGKLNDAADILSRGGPHVNDWSLNPIIVEMIWDRFGKAQVDLFAAKANHKCPLWFSLSPSDDPHLGLNALGHTAWPVGLLYAYPPYSLLDELLSRFEKEGSRMILVATNEPQEPWFPRMRPWIQGTRFDIPLWQDALSQANGLITELPLYRGARLAAWMLTKPNF